MRTMEELIAHLAKLRQDYRPQDRWCKFCSRKHNPRDACDLYLRTRKSKAGNEVKRWCH